MKKTRVLLYLSNTMLGDCLGETLMNYGLEPKIIFDLRELVVEVCMESKIPIIVLENTPYDNSVVDTLKWIRNDLKQFDSHIFLLNPLNFDEAVSLSDLGKISFLVGPIDMDEMAQELLRKINPIN